MAILLFANLKILLATFHAKRGDDKMLEKWQQLWAFDDISNCHSSILTDAKKISTIFAG